MVWLLINIMIFLVVSYLFSCNSRELPVFPAVLGNMSISRLFANLGYRGQNRTEDSTLFPLNSEKPLQIQLMKRSPFRLIFVKSASATFVYNATLATRPIQRFQIKNIHYLNQSLLSAFPVSRIRCHLVSSPGNQGHHFQKIGESKTENIL